MMTALLIVVLFLIFAGSCLALYVAWWCDRMEKREAMENREWSRWQ